jgi:hypothetical protein
MNVKLGRLRRISAAEGMADKRRTALEHMLKALELLDADPSISPLVGTQLQLTIDRLLSSQPSSSRIR